MVLLPWLKELLKRHAPYLISQSDLAHSCLADLYHIIEARLESFQKFVELHGKLDLLFCQVQIRKKASEQPGEPNKAQKKALVVLHETEE
jgi:hypothetical protein